MRVSPGVVVGVQLLAATASAQEDPDYPLGKIGIPPITRPAEPLRLVDLRTGFARNGATISQFETRLKLGDLAFFGGEVRGERLGAFIETQRLEAGVTEENGALDLEGAYRGSFFRVGVDAGQRRDDTWNLVGNGFLRLSSDWEIVLGYRHDTDDSRGGAPSIDEFITTGTLPLPGRPTRVLRSGSLGFVYQWENALEVSGDAGVSRERTEAGIDRTRSRAGGIAIWNVASLELDGSFFFDRVSGRIERTEGVAELGAAFRLFPHLVLTGRAREEWQPGVERFFRDSRFGATWFGRRFRFGRSSEFAEEVLRLARRANELGYNERRVYDVDGLRAFRERLSLSPAREELADAIDALYLAEVRERNVPQIGVEYARTADAVVGSETDAYRVFVGVPWHLTWPFTRGEDRVDFLRFDWTLQAQQFPSLGTTAHTHVVTATAELSRQHILRIRWESPGQTPEQLAFRIRRPRRWSAEYVYALGR